MDERIALFAEQSEIWNTDGDYMNACSGSHIMDCWDLWNEARNMRIMK